MEKEKDFCEWTRKEFENLPYLSDFNNDIGEVDSLVILPTGINHDSGFRCMEFVTIQKGKPTYRVSGCSDIIHLGGIGGYNSMFANEEYSKRVKTQKVPKADWRIDCLPTSGLLRLFCHRHSLYIGQSLSSFEVFFKECNE